MDEDNKSEKTTLKDYFNKKCFGAFGMGPPALSMAFFSVVSFAKADSSAIVALGIVSTILAFGFANRWQEQATGKHLWKPKLFPWWGL